MTRRLVLLSALLTALTLSNANSATVQQGVTDCGTWVKARSEKTADNLEAHLLGLLNGMALSSDCINGNHLKIKQRRFSRQIERQPIHARNKALDPSEDMLMHSSFV